MKEKKMLSGAEHRKNKSMVEYCDFLADQPGKYTQRTIKCFGLADLADHSEYINVYEKWNIFSFISFDGPQLLQSYFEDFLPFDIFGIRLECSLTSVSLLSNGSNGH